MAKEEAIQVEATVLEPLPKLRTSRVAPLPDNVRRWIMSSVQRPAPDVSRMTTLNPVSGKAISSGLSCDQGAFSKPAKGYSKR